MKSVSANTYSLMLSTLLIAGCSGISPTIPPDVSTTVIESILPNSPSETPWRLHCAWQGGELSGAALRASSIEHVVTQAKPLTPQKLTKPGLVSAGSTIEPITESGSVDANVTAKAIDQESIDRVWQKYCHHQLDMSADDHALIAITQIPFKILKHGCNPGSLMK